jgi:predicted short-subunit dehydrogenase-like oxidoreductase (DUF2520 family)
VADVASRVWRDLLAVLLDAVEVLVSLALDTLDQIVELGLVRGRLID